MAAQSKVCVLILNWNGWRDTIECLESVFRIDYDDYRVIVCDNGSDDGSLERIKAWAEGRQEAEVEESNPLRGLSYPPVAKPISYVEYDRTEAEAGGKPDEGGVRLILIQTGGNLGFAGGNNVGLRCALAMGDFDYVWLLNNDTVVRPDALTRLVERMSERPDAGMCGARLLDYRNPDTILALGGARYWKWLGLPRHIGFGQPANTAVDAAAVERRLDYITGASLLVSRDYLTKVGLMSEAYFLYYEELDWAERGKRWYKLAYAPLADVYHKEGASAGASRRSPGAKSAVADYWSIRNRLAVTRKFFPEALPTVRLGLLVSAVNRIRRKQWDRVRMILGLWWQR